MSNFLENDCLDNSDGMNTHLESYLEELDSWQRGVHNIRIMHHDVWKGSRLSPYIKQHRAGSRVERQTRILPTGGQTDVDYMFEVVGLEVLCDGNQGSINFKSCPCKDFVRDASYDMTNTYGKIYVSSSYKSRLECHEMYGKILALCPEHPKRDQNPKFTPLSETTSIPVCFIWESPPPGSLASKQKPLAERERGTLARSRVICSSRNMREKYQEICLTVKFLPHNCIKMSTFIKEN